MQYETALGLRKEHSFDEVRRYVQTDPDTIKFPKRDAISLQQSHIYAQVEASMRNYGSEAQTDQARYRETDESAPYAPPESKPPSDDRPQYPEPPRRQDG